MRTGDAAAITAYAVEAQRTALCDAKRIFDELSWHLVKMNFNDGDFSEKKSIPERRPFSTAMPAERAPRTKVALIAEACTTNRSVVGCRTTSKATAAAGFVPLVLPLFGIWWLRTHRPARESASVEVPA